MRAIHLVGALFSLMTTLQQTLTRVRYSIKCKRQAKHYGTCFLRSYVFFYFHSQCLQEVMKVSFCSTIALFS